MTQMTTRDAAGRLGISQRQVQRLIAAGRLPSTRTAGDAWVVEALAVNAMTRARPDRGRPWSPATAWAALWRLSGLEVDWLDRRTTSRLTARLKSISPEELLHATRRRAREDDGTPQLSQERFAHAVATDDGRDLWHGGSLDEPR